MAQFWELGSFTPDLHQICLRSGAATLRVCSVQRCPAIHTGCRNCWGSETSEDPAVIKKFTPDCVLQQDVVHIKVDLGVRLQIRQSSVGVQRQVNDLGQSGSDRRWSSQRDK